MQCASTSTYPKNLGRGGLLPAELGGRVCPFVFFCPSRYDARHRKPRWCVYVLNLGGTDIRPQDSFSYRSNFRCRSSFRSSFRFRSRFRYRSNFHSSFSFSFSFSFRSRYRSNVRFRSSFRSRSSSTTSGDIFYCSGSRQLNHSSLSVFFVCPSRYDARHRKPRRCV